MDGGKDASEIKPEDIKTYFTRLTNLRLTGQQIKELYEAEIDGQNAQVKMFK